MTVKAQKPDYQQL